jgi:hypothetical protein
MTGKQTHTPSSYLLLIPMLMLVLVLEDAAQILLPPNDADERANDPIASLYSATSKARMTNDKRFKH